MMRDILFSVLVIAAAAPATAEGSLSTADGSALVSLVEGWTQPDGSRMAAIEIALAPGWHTYWRVPGEAGIPPEFDWSGSKNLASVRYEWPRPMTFDTYGSVGIGYSGKLVLPVVLSPERAGVPIEASLRLFFGVCREVCLPAEANLSARFFPGTTSRGDDAIDAALADRPRTAREAGVTEVSCAVAAGPRGYELTAEVTFAAPPSGRNIAVVEADRPDLWIGLADSEIIGRKLVLRAPVEAIGGAGPVLDRGSLRFTLIDDRRAIDIPGCGAPG